MDDLTIIPHGLVAVSQSLEAAIYDRLNPHPDVGVNLALVNDAMRREAKSAADAMRAQCEPATFATVKDWLAMLNNAVKNPMEREEFLDRCEAITIACGDLPHVVFTPATQREALRTFEFFPSVAQVHALLRPHGAPLTARRAALKAIGKMAAPEPTEPVDKGPEAQEHVAAVVASFMAERSWNAPGAKAEAKAKIRPAYLTGEQLAAARARMAGQDPNRPAGKPSQGGATGVGPMSDSGPEGGPAVQGSQVA